MIILIRYWFDLVFMYDFTHQGEAQALFTVYFSTRQVPLFHISLLLADSKEEAGQTRLTYTTDKVNIAGSLITR